MFYRPILNLLDIFHMFKILFIFQRYNQNFRAIFYIWYLYFSFQRYISYSIYILYTFHIYILHIISSKTTVLRSIPFRSSVSFWNCCTLLALPISPEIMDGFWCSRCLNDRVDLLYMIESFANGANVSLVAKNGTKKIILLVSIKSSAVDTCLKEIARQP